MNIELVYFRSTSKKKLKKKKLVYFKVIWSKDFKTCGLKITISKVVVYSSPLLELTQTCNS